MRKVFAIAVLCMISLAGSQAQNHTHSWKMGPLTWNDFSPNNAIGSQYSHLEYFMGIQGGVDKRNGVTYLHPSVGAFMSSGYSWADPRYRTPQLLAYHQCAFDLVELHRRRLENYIMDGKANLLELVDPDLMLDKTMLLAGEEIARLKAETLEGRDSTRLRQWQDSVRHQLDSIPQHSFTTHHDAPMRWGLTFDGGYTYVGGGLHDYLGNGLIFGFIGEVGYRHHFVSLTCAMGGSRCLDTMYHINSAINTLYPGYRVSHFDFYMAYGYAVVDNARIRLVPFVGYGTQQFYYNDFNNYSHGPTDGCLHAGLDFHYNYSNQVEVNEFLLKFHYNSLHNITSFHTRLFATFNRFESVVGAPTGFTINLQLGFGLMTGRARCE